MAPHRHKLEQHLLFGKPSLGELLVGHAALEKGILAIQDENGSGLTIGGPTMKPLPS
jgi:hypothetical protein